MKTEAVNRAGMKMIRETGFAFLQHTYNLILVVFKYSFLFILLFLLASHESANPELGNTSFEFYSSEFRSAILNDESNRSLSFDNNSLEEQLTVRFYQERHHMPAWTSNFEVQSAFTELMNLLGNSYQYGLIPSSYNYKLLSELAGKLAGVGSTEQKLETRVQLERTTTVSALRFMNHLGAGIRIGDTTLAYQQFQNNLPGYLNTQLTNNTLREGILNIQPGSRQYIKLQRAASKFLGTAISDTIEYSIDDLASDRKLLARRLIRRGYLDQSFVDDTAALQTALRNFQRGHCLEVNGEIDNNTLSALTENVKNEFYKIAINLDRLRKDELKNEECILVNIPEFQLHYYDKTGKSRDYNVIVGTQETPTPVLTSQIEWIIANPYWTVPVSITRNEIIPLIKKDSLYLQKHGFSIVDNDLNTIDPSTIDWNSLNPKDFNYWFRQNNDNNVLGVIKFLFPNPHSVFLHDTQAKKLFDKPVRAFSHGCIRLQNPEELAQLIASAYCGSVREIDIESTIHSKNHREIKVEKPLPIYIRYYSCTVDSSDNLFFHPDIYAMDNVAINELFGSSSWQ